MPGTIWGEVGESLRPLQPAVIFVSCDMALVFPELMIDDDVIRWWAMFGAAQIFQKVFFFYGSET